MSVVLEFPEAPQFEFLIDLQGQSLYQKWLELGNVGTESDFLNWLKVDSAVILGTGTTGYLQKVTSSGVIGNSLVFDSGSNVGIGTITPSSYLNYRFLALNGADGAVLQLRKGDVTFAEIGGDGTFVNYDAFEGTYSKFSIGGVEKLRIDTSAATFSVKLKALCPIYANEASATADATLLSGQFYKITGSKIVYQK